MIPKLNTYFFYHHLFHSNATKSQAIYRPVTFTCKRTRCKTYPFISSAVKISEPNRSVKVTDHFTCISTNVIYCISCTLCKKIYIGETERKLVDRFREHLRDVEKNNSKKQQMRSNQWRAILIFLITPTMHNMTIWRLSLHHGNTESRKNLEEKFIFQLGTLSLHELMNASHSTNLFTNSCDHFSTNGKAPLHSYINHNTSQFCSL